MTLEFVSVCSIRDPYRNLRHTPRHVQYRSVRCPKCNAGRGKTCRTPAGHPISQEHAARVALAVTRGNKRQKAPDPPAP